LCKGADAVSNGHAVTANGDQHDEMEMSDYGNASEFRRKTPYHNTSEIGFY